MNIRYAISVMVFCLTVSGVRAFAQDAVADTIPAGYELVDSLVYVPAPLLNTDLAGKNIFLELPLVEKGGASDVRVHQSQGISTAMNTHFRTNSSRAVCGYRVRIFFDNKQTSRYASEAALKRFVEQYNDVAAYRSYVNPYFKVTVGDFRTKSEAMQLLQKIRGAFPSAFIVKENINYPVVDRERPVVEDTVRVLRPVLER